MRSSSTHEAGLTGVPRPQENAQPPSTPSVLLLHLRRLLHQRTSSGSISRNVRLPRFPPLIEYNSTSLFKKAPPSDLTVGLCMGSKGGARGGGVLSWAKYPCVARIKQSRPDSALVFQLKDFQAF